MQINFWVKWIFSLSIRFFQSVFPGRWFKINTDAQCIFGCLFLYFLRLFDYFLIGLSIFRKNLCNLVFIHMLFYVSGTMSFIFYFLNACDTIAHDKRSILEMDKYTSKQPQFSCGPVGCNVITGCFSVPNFAYSPSCSTFILEK